MRFLLPIILVFVPSFGSKEHVLLQNLPDDEKSLLFELVKRLDKDGVYDDVGWMDKALSMRQCAVTTNTSSIIKRIDSENNGAKILTLHEDIETNEACADLCCKNKSCDLAVYENKGDRHCYLFQCGGKCLFGHHSSYISNSIMHLSKQAPTAADGSELDLINLDQDSDSMGSNKGGLFSTTTPAPATPAPTPAPYIRAHSVGLGGPHCERDLHCEDPNAVCNYHKCRCREGYYQKGHICRENCPPSNFGCLELGTLGRGPQCVSQSQVCDSVMQCADGSDEFNCPESDGPFKNEGALNQNSKPRLPGGSDSGRPGDNQEEKPDTPKAAPQGGEQSSSDNGGKPSQQRPSPSADPGDGNKPAENTKGSHPEAADKEDPPPVNTTPAHHQAGFPQAKEDSDLAQGSSTGQGGAPLGKSGSEAEDLIRSQNAFISKVKLDRPKEAANMQGPIIALSLGLAFTVVLLVFVACRLRTVRRRLRKGRPLHSNEADYLINGMYL